MWLVAATPGSIAVLLTRKIHITHRFVHLVSRDSWGPWNLGTHPLASLDLRLSAYV